MLQETRARIAGHWSRRFGVPVPGLTPVTVGSGVNTFHVVSLLLGDRAYVHAPVERLPEVADVAGRASLPELLSTETWAELSEGPSLGVIDWFWADHSTPLPGPGAARPVPVERLEELRPQVPELEWRWFGAGREPTAAFGVEEDGRLVGASVMTSLFGWPVDVGLLVPEVHRGRGIGQEVISAALASGVGLAGFAAVRVPREVPLARDLVTGLGLAVHGATLQVPLA